MVKAAAERGWIDGPAVALEQLTAVKRAGADFVLTYFAGELAEVARWLSGPAPVGRRVASERCSSGPERGHPRRGQLTGALVPLGRGPPLLRGPRGGRLRLGRRREPAPRLRPVLRRLHPRSRPSGGGRGRWPRPRPRGTTFGAPTEGEVLLAEAICARVRRVRAGAPGVVGNRGGHERGPGGPGLHRTRPGSSSSPAATTATPTVCWPAGAAGWPPWACPTRPACRPARWPRRWWPPTTGSPSSTSGWPA